MRSFAALFIVVVLLAAPCWATSGADAPDKGMDAAQTSMEHTGHDMGEHAMDDQNAAVHDMADHNMADQNAAGHDMSGHDMGDQPMDAPHDHEKMMEEAEKADLPVGIEEHLGAMLPDVPFTDSEGNRVTLPELADAPILLLPIYYRCPDVCNLLQGSVASILPEVKLAPGKELKVVSLSFDARENPKDAARAKRNYTAISGDAFPAEYWTFLTGDQASIDAVLNTIGYTVQKQGGLWAHPVAAIAIAPGGKVVRYLYGTSFLPFDITMAGTEAARGQTGLSVKRLLSFCYNYDPQGRRYVFDILRVSGFTIVGFVVIFLAWLLLGGKKKKRQ
ncbi:SCO family protein [uncultured Pseudodesulfovibrio sp.]|uniref:SCO family protein n=1 Tax=uncultured Pseudodesulfovibrio sp. TaxID=2035858 RepID=UPI0029C65B7E|nr:SCO family protein [uncultured Pseudodesulfovibrio sp.]